MMIALFSGKLAAEILHARHHGRASASGDLVDPRSLSGRQRSLNRRLSSDGIAGVVGLRVGCFRRAGVGRVDRR